MEEDAVVHRRVFTLAPGFGAPFEFEHEVVVTELILRGDITVAAPADVKGAVGRKGPDVLGVIVKIHLRIHVMLHSTGFDDLKQIDFLRDWLGRQDRGGGKGRQEVME